MKIFCVGRNYIDHVKELNRNVSDKLLFFIKPSTALLIHNRPFYIPDWTQNVHCEVELVMKICKNGKCIQERFAHTYYNEIGVGVDLTARDLQDEAIAKGLPWEKAKAFDFSAPIGEFLQKEQLNMKHGIDFSLKKNGKVCQNGSSKEMLFSFDAIISEISQYITLKQGDYIFSGTPKGVGRVEKGDLLEAFIGDELMLRVPIK